MANNGINGKDDDDENDRNHHYYEEENGDKRRDIVNSRGFRHREQNVKEN